MLIKNRTAWIAFGQVFEKLWGIVEMSWESILASLLP